MTRLSRTSASIRPKPCAVPLKSCRSLLTLWSTTRLQPSDQTEAVRGNHSMKFKLALLLAVLALVTACSHKAARVAVPAAPAPERSTTADAQPEESAEGTRPGRLSPEIEIPVGT